MICNRCKRQIKKANFIQKIFGKGNYFIIDSNPYCKECSKLKIRELTENQKEFNRIRKEEEDKEMEKKSQLEENPIPPYLKLPTEFPKELKKENQEEDEMKDKATEEKKPEIREARRLPPAFSVANEQYKKDSKHGISKNPWLAHVQEVKNRPENYGKSYKEIIEIAKEDYVKLEDRK